MKHFLYYFSIALLFSISQKAFAQNYLEKESNINTAEQNVLKAEFEKSLSALSDDEKNKKIEELQTINSMEKIGALFPDFYKEKVQPQLTRQRSPFNSTYCLNSCKNCGAQITDAGAMISTLGKCVATCVRSPDAVAQKFARQCFDIFKAVYPKPEPPKDPPKEPEPPKEEPPKEEPQPPGEIKIVNQELSCKLPQSIFKDGKYAIIKDFLENRVGRFTTLPKNARLIIEKSHQQAGRPLPQGAGQLRTAAPPPEAKKEKLGLGAILKAGTKLITGDVAGAGQTLDQESRAVDQRNQWRQNYQNQQYYRGAQQYGGYPQGYQQQWQRGRPQQGYQPQYGQFRRPAPQFGQYRRPAPQFGQHRMPPPQFGQYRGPAPQFGQHRGPAPLPGQYPSRPQQGRPVMQGAQSFPQQQYSQPGFPQHPPPMTSQQQFSQYINMGQQARPLIEPLVRAVVPAF